jgi:hypothetical protein
MAPAGAAGGWVGGVCRGPVQFEKRPEGVPPGRHPSRFQAGTQARPDLLSGSAQNRSFSMTFVQAAAKSFTNFAGASSWA